MPALLYIQRLSSYIYVLNIDPSETCSLWIASSSTGDPLFFFLSPPQPFQKFNRWRRFFMQKKLKSEKFKSAVHISLWLSNKFLTSSRAEPRETMAAWASNEINTALFVTQNHKRFEIEVALHWDHQQDELQDDSHSHHRTRFQFSRFSLRSMSSYLLTPFLAITFRWLSSEFHANMER
jgi:hypothetical protein